ncbi:MULTISPECIES: hypothetical protein [unclassified Streptomyces]|uniref:hypothetical protein n=1 Tax=unclassified Streptomyces TaxID=2593676 RepID=UPI000A7E9C9F|nr:hypothetical protein [Streptomyces sp. TSRI0281]
MDATTRNTVFAAAAQATHWTRLNTGLRTEVLNKVATWGQTAGIVETAMGALRAL